MRPSVMDGVQAKRMEADILDVVAAFSTALHSAVGAFSTFDSSEDLGYDNANAALERDAATAVDRLAESLRRLMFAVVLVSVPPELLV